jgi:hypothetical protein
VIPSPEDVQALQRAQACQTGHAMIGRIRAVVGRGIRTDFIVDAEGAQVGEPAHVLKHRVIHSMAVRKIQGFEALQSLQ